MYFVRTYMKLNSNLKLYVIKIFRPRQCKSVASSTDGRNVGIIGERPYICFNKLRIIHRTKSSKEYKSNLIKEYQH